MDDSILGKNLKSLRQNKNITQPELAKRIGISLSSIQKHEAGSGISKRLLEKYVKFYGCDRNWLLTGIGEPYINKYRIEGEGGIANISEALEEYPERAPILGQAVDMLATVLGSENEVFIRSLMSHLVASKEAVNLMNQQNQRLSALQSELDAVRKRLAALEEKLQKEGGAGKEENVEKTVM